MPVRLDGRAALLAVLAIGSLGLAAPAEAAQSPAHPADDREMGDGLADYEVAAAGLAAGRDPVAAAREDEITGEREPMAATCADGVTTLGIDISKWQGDVDWTKVANGGVKFAFVRVSHGLNTIDQWFDSNWAEARAAGLHVGVYQYFEPGQSATAQADLLLERMGALGPGDLPPVIDVESHGNLPAAEVAAAVTEWVARVEGATGVKPIVYTGRYFWQDYVKSAAFAGYPLWIAHYTNACPNLPSQWADWTVHQYTDKGVVNGVSGPTDTNRFNGDEAALLAFASGSDGGGDEPPPPAAGGCGVIAPEGDTIIDNGEECYVLQGSEQWWRNVAGVGIDNDVVWTGTTKSTKTNSAEVAFEFEVAGIYRLEANIPKPHNTTKQAKYKIQHAGGLASVTVNQSTKNGWVSLGDYSFDAGTGQSVSLADLTGEANSLGRKVVFDAFRLTMIGQGARQGGDDAGAGLGGVDYARGDGEASCAVGGPGAGAGWAFGVLLLGLSRRRPRG